MEFAYIVIISFINDDVCLNWMLVALKCENWSRTIEHVSNSWPLLSCERMGASIQFNFSILSLHMYELLSILQIEQRSNIWNLCIDLYWPLQFGSWDANIRVFVWCSSDTINFSNAWRSVLFHHESNNCVANLKVSHLFII